MYIYIYICVFVHLLCECLNICMPHFVNLGCIMFLSKYTISCSGSIGWGSDWKRNDKRKKTFCKGLSLLDAFF